ncbi:MAG TPA: UbiA family prenyltransferase [Thermomicrobiaceae bacterium]|nr:UbiA family prenyltransferase [Thermomicrobiaceae bacterium]
MRGTATCGARVRAYLELPHPTAILLVMGATAVVGLLASRGRPNPVRYGLLLAAMLAGQIAVGALNEYCDRDLDTIGNPSKPIPAGLVGAGTALGIALGALGVMLVAGALLGRRSLLLLSLANGSGLVYDLWLKRTRLSWLPYLVALPLVPIWAWDSLARPEPRLLLLYPLGAPLVVAVHLAQSLPDVESDRAAGAGGLAARLGRSRAFVLCWCAAAVAALAVGAAAIFLARDRLPALGAAGAVLLALLGVLGLRRAAPGRVERHLFTLLGACAVVLGTGWILAVAG